MISEITYFTHNKFASHRKIEKHEIKFSELTFLISGEMIYYVNGVRHPISGGDIIYVPSGSVRQRETGDVPNDYVSINFHSRRQNKRSPCLYRLRLSSRHNVLEYTILSRLRGAMNSYRKCCRLSAK